MQKHNPQDLTFIQSRAEMNPVIITEYAGLMADGVEFDPLEGIRDENGRIYIWDGQHRGEAAKMVGIKLAVNLQPGNRSQAEWLALTANHKHGLRRTAADKQRVVRLALRHPNGVNLSDREIARHCGVDHKTVGTARKQLEASGEIPQIATRQVTRNGAVYTQKTTKIGSNNQPPEVRYCDWCGTRHKLQAANADSPTPTPCPACNHTYRGIWLKNPRSLSGEIPQINTLTTQNPEPATLNSPNSTNPNCPRCGQDRIAGVNGSRRWCLNCNAEWPTAAEFLGEADQREDRDPLPLREQLLIRFEALLSKASTSKLGDISDWLVDLENEIQANRRPSLNDDYDPYRRLLAATTKRAVDDLKSPEPEKQGSAAEFLSTNDGQFFLQHFGGLAPRHAQEFVAQSPLPNA